MIFSRKKVATVECSSFLLAIPPVVVRVKGLQGGDEKRREKRREVRREVRREAKKRCEKRREEKRE